jgi:hypothetical protein
LSLLRLQWSVHMVASPHANPAPQAKPSPHVVTSSRSKFFLLTSSPAIAA